MTGTYAWMDQALCAQTDPDAFHPEGSGHNYRTAARICAACPVRNECGQHAARFEGDSSHRDRHGMWAGQAPRTRVDQVTGAAKQQRDALILRLHARGGMSAEEIAKAAGCDERTVYRIAAAHRGPTAQAAA